MATFTNAFFTKILYNNVCHENQLPANPTGRLYWQFDPGAGPGGPGSDGWNYQIFVSNEKSGNLTVASRAGFKVVATIPVGKRPRGIHASPDGKTVYVALSGTPIEPPPKLDANGNPVFQKGRDDEEDKAPADKSADGIGLVDVAQKNSCARFPPVRIRNNSA